MSKQIVCRNVIKHYQDGVETQVLKGIDLKVSSAESIAIVGASGSGKSTLLQIMGGLDQPTQGEVFINGHCIHRLNAVERGRVRNKTLGFVYQFHHLLAEFTALENVAMPLLVRRENTAIATREARKFLQSVGLGDRVTHRPSELSGGERQRVAIARALVTKPDFLLADEPTGNLDRQTAETVFELLLELKEQAGTSLVMVTHDMTLAARADRILQLQAGILSLHP